MTRLDREDFITDLFEKGDLIKSRITQKTGVVTEITLHEDDSHEMHEWVTVLWDGTEMVCHYIDDQYADCIINLSKKLIDRNAYESR